MGGIGGYIPGGGGSGAWVPKPIGGGNGCGVKPPGPPAGGGGGEKAPCGSTGPCPGGGGGGIVISGQTPNMNHTALQQEIRNTINEI